MTNGELRKLIEKFKKNETLIPKPKNSYVKITAIGTTKIGNVVKEGFQYSPVNANYKKYVPFETLFLCHKKLLSSKKLSRDWFEQQFPDEYKGRPCNFTTIGGIFIKMKIAKYDNRIYVLRNE